MKKRYEITFGLGDFITLVSVGKCLIKVDGDEFWLIASKTFRESVKIANMRVEEEADPIKSVD